MPFDTLDELHTLGKHSKFFEIPPAKCQRTESSIDTGTDLSSQDLKSDDLKRESEPAQEEDELSDIKLEELSQKAIQSHPTYYKWVEENNNDEKQKAAFFTLFNIEINDKNLLEAVHDLPKCLVNNYIINAMGIYLYSFGIDSSTIYHFIMHLREDVETDSSFRTGIARLSYKSFINLEIQKLQKPPQCFKGAFAQLMLKDFEPYLEKIMGNKFPNQEALKFLYEKYQEPEKNFNTGLFHIKNAENIYLKLLKKEKLEGRENELVKFVEELKAGFQEKVALLSLTDSNQSILQKIRAAPKTLDTNTFIAALCVYLGHFGVQSNHVYSFLIKARPEAEPCRSFTSNTPGTMYKNFYLNSKKEYFDRDFSFLMIEIFEPLSVIYRAPNEFIIHYDALIERHREYQEKLDKKNNVALPAKQDMHIKDDIYNQVKERAYIINPSLSEWIETSCNDVTKKCALFSLITVEIQTRKTMEKWVEVIKAANSLSHHNYLIAGIIYLRHFEIDSLYIYNLIEHIRGKSCKSKEFTPITSLHYYEKFVQVRNNMLPNPPAYLTHPTLLNTLNTFFLPLLRDMTENPGAEF